MSEITNGVKLPKVAENKGETNAANEAKAGIVRGSKPAGEGKASEGPRRHEATQAYLPAEYGTKNGLTRRDN